jgi:hypothetical protein
LARPLFFGAFTHEFAFCYRGSVNARFAPKPTEVLRCRELTGCFLPEHSALGVDASQVRHVASL